MKRPIETDHAIHAGLRATGFPVGPDLEKQAALLTALAHTRSLKGNMGMTPDQKLERLLEIVEFMFVKVL